MTRLNFSAEVPDVHDEPSGRQRIYHLTSEPLAHVAEWLHPFERSGRERLRSLADPVEEDPS